MSLLLALVLLRPEKPRDVGRSRGRVGELVRLELSDFNWRRGEVTIRGKARRQERLPLPVEVGEAVAEYVLGGKRVERQGAVFVSVDDPPRRLTAPWAGVAGAGTVAAGAPPGWRRSWGCAPPAHTRRERRR
jgi:integrase